MSFQSLIVASLTAARSFMAPRRPAGEYYGDARNPGRTHYLSGAILDQYRRERGPAGLLGRPVSQVRTAGADPRIPMGADHEVRFEHGAIYLNDATQATKVVRWGDPSR